MANKKLNKTEIKRCLRFWFGKLYIRLRDTDTDGRGNCISSGQKMYWTEGQGGHYIPNGSCKIHTWNEENVNFQCMQDNVWKNGNILRYRPALIDKIGKEKVERFEDTKNDIKQWKEYELIELIRKFYLKSRQQYMNKSEKVKQEIRMYVKKYEKKKRQTLYEDIIDGSFLL